MVDDQFVIFDNASDAIVVTDKRQRIVYWNTRAEELLGHTARSAIGKPCYQVIGGCVTGAAGGGSSLCGLSCPAMESARQRGSVEPITALVRRKDGEPVGVRVEHTFLYARQPERNDSFVVMHVLRELCSEEQPPAAGLRVRLLGPTAALLPDGQRVVNRLWQRKMVRALLAVLALHGERGIHREELLELLWPGKERDAALANLNVTIYYLRRALQPELDQGGASRFVAVNGDFYQLANPADHWVDVTVFEDTLDRARAAASPATAISLYERALRLYRGDFLADLDLDAGRYLNQREYLYRRFMTGLKELARLLEAQGQERSAEEIYLQILQHDELDEEACGHAMRLMLQRGARTGALACYQQMQERLRAELDVEPEPALAALYGQATRPAPPAQPRSQRRLDHPAETRWAWTGLLSVE